MKLEGNSSSSWDNTNGSESYEAPFLPQLSHGSRKSSWENDSSPASHRQNNSEKILGVPNETSREPSPEPSPPSKLRSTSSSPQHSNAFLGTELEEEEEEEEEEEDADELLKDILRSPFQRRKGHLDKEWTFYPSSGHQTYHTGKKCVFDGLHLRNKMSTSERTLEMRIGKKKYATEIDSRNGIPRGTLGDHPYACPEQSRDFHKMGSTMPVVNFGSAVYKKKADTFIPLEHLPAAPCVPFSVKEKQRELEREKMEVRNLEFWKPAPTLLQTLFPSGLGRRMTYQPY